jgi:hypothetical protein
MIFRLISACLGVAQHEEAGACHTMLTLLSLLQFVSGAPVGDYHILSRGARSGPPPSNRVGASQSETSSLYVRFPEGSGKAPVSVPHTDALFGIPAYGGGVGGQLVYPVNEARFDGCQPLSQMYSGNILLLNRSSSCTFATRVSNAQRAGAFGVVVSDSAGLCGEDSNCPADGPACGFCAYGYTTSTDCQCALPMMADDGSGRSISIPSFLVSRMNGAMLREFAAKAQGSRPWASLAWDIPTAAGAVRYELWQDADDAVATVFREGFSPYLPLLGSTAAFTPHFYNIDGRAHGCTQLDCATQCINGGYYCAEDPDGDLFKGISGADVS